MLRSAGLDKRFDTGDDLVSYLEVRTVAATGRPSVRKDGIGIDIEHDRGPFNGLAEIAGSSLGGRTRRTRQYLEQPSPCVMLPAENPARQPRTRWANSVWRVCQPVVMRSKWTSPVSRSVRRNSSSRRATVRSCR